MKIQLEVEFWFSCCERALYFDWSFWQFLSQPWIWKTSKQLNKLPSSSERQNNSNHWTSSVCNHFLSFSSRDCLMKFILGLGCYITKETAKILAEPLQSLTNLTNLNLCGELIDFNMFRISTIAKLNNLIIFCSERIGRWEIVSTHPSIETNEISALFGLVMCAVSLFYLQISRSIRFTICATFVLAVNERISRRGKDQLRSELAHLHLKKLDLRYGLYFGLCCIAIPTLMKTKMPWSSKMCLMKLFTTPESPEQKSFASSKINKWLIWFLKIITNLPSIADIRQRISLWVFYCSQHSHKSPRNGSI